MPRNEFVRWARAHAVPLDNLTPLAGMVRGARVVAVSETWHPVHEFLEVQFAIARFLIERMDFTVLLLEASLTTSRQLDTYVNGGPRTELALSSVWDNQETIDFLDWLRERNATAANPVRIHGLDLHILIMDDTGRPGASSALAVIERLDGDLPHVETVRRVFADFAAIDGDPRVANFTYFRSLSPETRQRVKEAFTVAAQRLSRLDDEWALHRATTVLQALRMYDADTARGLAIRAAAMAENARWALDRHAGGKAVLLGTSVHAARAPWSYAGSDVVIPSIGMRLARLFGKEYVALATTFNRGSFDPPHPITGTTTVPDGDPDSLDLAHAEAGAGFLIDLRDAPPGWIDEPHPLRPMQNVAAPPAYPLRQAFDLVVHVDEIRGAQPRHGIVSHPL